MEFAKTLADGFKKNKMFHDILKQTTEKSEVTN